METPDGEVVLGLVVSENRSWMPDEPVIETYALERPENVPDGTYHLVVGMAFESSGPPHTPSSWASRRSDGATVAIDCPPLTLD